MSSQAIPTWTGASKFRYRKATYKRWLIAYALVAPVVLWRMATTLYPFFRTAYLSFFDQNPVRRTDDYIGLDNYREMWDDPAIRDALHFTFTFTVASVALQVVLGLAIAMLLNQQLKFQSLARAINLLPWAMSSIVMATAAKWIFNQDYGLVNDIVWRISGERPIWLINVDNAKLAVILTDVWKNTPFVTVLLLGALQGVPDDLLEAARVDGAGKFRSFLSITLPLITPMVISVALFTAIFRLLSFEIVYALTEGGPGTATSLLSYSVYVQAFRTLNFGYASALAMGLFGIVLVVGLVGFALVRRAWARL
jgi:multiple sugar transport system permease protein